jgi:hypothetical protein
MADNQSNSRPQILVFILPDKDSIICGRIEGKINKTVVGARVLELPGSPVRLGQPHSRVHQPPGASMRLGQPHSRVDRLPTAASAP